MASLRLSSTRRASLLVLLLIPGALTAFLSFHSGGFFPATTALVAIEMVLLVMLRLAIAQRPFTTFSSALVVCVSAMAALTAWTLLSSAWSSSPYRATVEFNRTLLYGATLLLFGTVARSPARLRVMLYGLACAITAVCVAGLLSRTLPGLITGISAEPKRLNYPITYWNALGLLAGVGTILCMHITCSLSESRLARILAAGAVPLLVTTLYFTLSRGAIWTTVLGLAVYLLVGRPRALVAGAISAGSTSVVALATSNTTGALTAAPLSHTATIEGHHVALTLAGCALAAALLRAAVLPLDERIAARLSMVGRPVIVVFCAALLAVAGLGAVAAHVPSVAVHEYHQFVSRSPIATPGAARLFNVNSDGRIDLWHVAINVFSRHPLDGTGAGTYELAWARERPGTSSVRDAHSLYLETLAELGIVGFVLLLIALTSILGTFAYRARGPNRAIWAAVLAAGVTWALAAAVDWDWEIPAVTLWLFAFGGIALARVHVRPQGSPPGSRSSALTRFGITGTNLMRLGVVVALAAVAIVPGRTAIAQSRADSAVSLLEAGSCARARSRATASLAVMKIPVAYQVIAWCEYAHDPRASAIAIRAALRQDPNSWELHYSLAVAQAFAGLDPWPQMRLVHQLNPHEARVNQAIYALPDRAGASAWRRWAVDAGLRTLPRPGE